MHHGGGATSQRTAMANSACEYTMEEVLDMLNDVEEVICDGSDNDLGMESSDSDASDVDEQRYSIDTLLA